uniref:Hydin adenylate kinase-like domain-containing protein n=1 Tax=Cyprinus carpio TaxID=7962 RepID=A0A8C1VWI8_CYPCA
AIFQVFSLSPARLSLAPGHSAEMLLEGSSDIPKMVTEKLLCYAVVGRQYVRECIMSADVTCQFVSPAVDISSQQINFYVEKAPDVSLVPLYQRLVLKSLSSLNLSMELTLHEPFGLCDYDGDELYTTSKSLVLAVGAKKELWVRFNPMYRQDRVTRMVEDVLEFCYHSHPQQDRVVLRGEVHFPNLKFSSTTLDFGCILNNTKSRRKLTMTNCSPLCISYRWAFLVDPQHCHIGFFDETSRGTDTEAGGKRKESGEAQWELLEQKEADGKTDTNREADVIIPQLEEDELHPGSSNGQEQNRNYSTPRPLSTELGSKPISLTGHGHPSVGVKEVFDISSLYGELQPGSLPSDPKVPPSSASTRNKTNITGHSQKNNSSARTASLTDGQVHRRLSVSASQNEELGLISCLLPDDVLVEILSERLQLSDCHCGVVIDGLETLYCHSPSKTLQIILKAFDNRRHIYVINLFNSYSVFKLREQDKCDQEQEESRQQELETLREEEMTPSEDWDTKAKHEDPLPLSEDLQQEMVSLSVQFAIYLPSEDYSCEA